MTQRSTQRTGMGLGVATAAVAAAALFSDATAHADTYDLEPAAAAGTALDVASLGSGADDTGLNLAVSYDGVTLFHSGDATANSFASQGDLAIAYGAGATADAGEDPLSDGPITITIGNDYAFADGAGSTAYADGPFSSAVASGGATAYSGFDSNSMPDGSYDAATASGVGSVADAFGDTSSASVSGTDSTADAGSLAVGHDIADVFGNGSTAVAGDATGNGGNDFAAALGNDLSAIATGSHQFVTDPSLFGDMATSAAAVPADDFGLSSLGVDGLSPGLESVLNLF